MSELRNASSQPFPQSNCEAKHRLDVEQNSEKFGTNGFENEVRERNFTEKHPTNSDRHFNEKTSPLVMDNFKDDYFSA